jgi:Tol biopolymer transport system component
MAGVDGNQTGKLVNMGSPINTEFEDTMPSATRDGSLLYFNSDRPGGFGGFDIYEVRLR